MLDDMQIGVLGATGPAGRGLAARLAAAGHDVLVGSRDHARAAQVVEDLQARWGEQVATLQPATNKQAAGARDVIIVATNAESALETTAAHADLFDHKIVVAMANGLRKIGREFRAVIPQAGSLAEAMQALAPDARIVAAFQHVPAEALENLDVALETDVVVLADDDDARDTVMGLVAEIPGLRAFDGGSLANALGIEAFAAVLLSINLRHHGKATLRLSGVEGRE